MNVRTNNHRRRVLYGIELTEKERKQFDYYEPDELDTHEFVRYRGDVYDVDEFMHIDETSELRRMGWLGYHADSYFSGVLIKLVLDGEDWEAVMGTYYC